ncbi:MAG: hypothetical protein ABJF10_26200 [Chthoniobacter sp.]
MRSRSIILALILLMACALLIVPLFFGSILFALPSGGTSIYIGVGTLVALVLLAAIVGARRFFHRS